MIINIHQNFVTEVEVSNTVVVAAVPAQQLQFSCLQLYGGEVKILQVSEAWTGEQVLETVHQDSPHLDSHPSPGQTRILTSISEVVTRDHHILEIFSAQVGEYLRPESRVQCVNVLWQNIIMTFGIFILSI